MLITLSRNDMAICQDLDSNYVGPATRLRIADVVAGFHVGLVGAFLQHEHHVHAAGRLAFVKNSSNIELIARRTEDLRNSSQLFVTVVGGYAANGIEVIGLE